MNTEAIKAMQEKIYETQKMLKCFLMVLDNENQENIRRESLNSKLTAEFDLNNRIDNE